MSARQYSLRLLLTLVTTISICLGLIVIVAPKASRSLPAALGLHAAAAIVFVAFVGFILGRFRRVLITSFASAVVAELAWIAFIRTLGASLSAEDILYNPMLFFVVLTCPVACAKHRRRAAVIAFLLSAIIPISTAIFLLMRLSGARGSGMAGVIIILASAIAIAVGACAVAFTLMFFEAHDRTHTGLARDPTQPPNVANLNQPSN